LRETAGFLRIRSSFLALLALVGFAVVVSSSIGQDIEWISPENQFGLLQIVPPAYWLGLSLIVLSILLGIRNGNENLFFVQALLLFVSIWGASSFFEPYPSIPDTYIHYQTVESIIRTGSTEVGIYTYGSNYPGFFLLTAHYTLLGNPSVLTFLRFYPIFAAALTLLALCLFVRCYAPRLHYRYALLICVLANVWIQVHFSPQSLGFAAGILVFVFLEREGLEWLLAAVAVFSFIVVSHPTTVIFLIGAMVLREAALRTYRLLKRRAPLKIERPWPISIFLLIWVSWLFTGAMSYSDLLADTLSQRFGDIALLPGAAAETISLRTGGNLFPIPPLIRTATIGALVVLSFLSILFFIVKRKKVDQRLPANVLALFALPFIVVPLDIVLFNGQFYDRGFLFLVLGGSIIATLLIMGAMKGVLRALIAASVIIMVGASMTTTYYEESLYVMSGESLSASDFLDSHIANSSFVLGGIYPEHVWGDSPPSEFLKLKLATMYPQTYGNVSSRLSSASALVFDRSSELWHRQYAIMGIYKYYLKETANLTRVYDSGAYMIYSGGIAGR
jgi:hypothetical protein